MFFSNAVDRNVKLCYAHPRFCKGGDRMETIWQLQQRLLSYQEEQLQGLLQPYLERKLHRKIHGLFTVNASGNTSFLGTPADFRGMLDELLVIAASCGINIEKAVWKKYPGTCPYCENKPCNCEGRKETSHRRLQASPRSLTLHKAQAMLGEIYPPGKVSLQNIEQHIHEEIMEADLELWAWLLSAEGSSQKTEEEFADIFAWMMQAANTLDIPVEGLA